MRTILHGSCRSFTSLLLLRLIQGGIYLFELLNEYAANVSMVVVGFFEVYTVAYIYGSLCSSTSLPCHLFVLSGFNRFMNDVKMMLGKRAAQYYLFATWCVISPVLMLVSDMTGRWRDHYQCSCR